MRKGKKDTAETERPEEEGALGAWEASGVDLDQMSEEELVELVTAAIDRLPPTRLSEVIDAVQRQFS